MRILTNADIYAASQPGELVDCLAAAFGAAFASPDRMHCDLPGGDAKLLVMPSWQGREAIGVKVGLSQTGRLFRTDDPRPPGS